MEEPMKPGPMSSSSHLDDGALCVSCDRNPCALPEGRFAIADEARAWTDEQRADVYKHTQTT